MEIKQGELKQILKEQRQEYQRYVGALREDFDSKVDLIVEQYSDIKKTLNSHTQTLASHTQTLASHTQMIVSMKENIEVMKIDISFIKAGLKQKVDAEEFGVLERRVAILEAKAR
ncbi:MAG: hypothetical protein WAP23_03900 [Candidatus Spechtbacterales bacterium]